MNTDLFLKIPNNSSDHERSSVCQRKTEWGSGRKGEGEREIRQGSKDIYNPLLTGIGLFPVFPVTQDLLSI